MRIFAISAVLVALAALLTLPTPTQSAEMIRYGLCDVRVLYVFDDPASIDWPSLYYLNETFGCRIDLLTIGVRPGEDLSTKEIPNKEIALNTLFLPVDDSTKTANLIDGIFEDRLPDIVIFGTRAGDPQYEFVQRHLIRLARPQPRLFNILKVYRRFHNGTDNQDQPGGVVLNGRELYNRYRDRMKLELPDLYPRIDVDAWQSERLVRYILLKNNISDRTYEDNFMTGVTPLRLTDFIDSLFLAGPLRETISKQAKKYISFFNAARISVGSRKASFVVDGYLQMRQLNEHERATASQEEFSRYLADLLRKAEKAAMRTVGISWEGHIALRDSPHGPRLKFQAMISADGPKEIEIHGFAFHPYWDTTVVVLDAVPKVIAPHQTYAKEFLVDIDRSYLDGEIPDSLKFTVEIAYGQIPLTFTSYLPIWQAPKLSIEFVPDYIFVKPFPELDVDRVVSSLDLKAVITKPYNYSGTVQINLQTPRGLFAGSYRKEVQLDRGVLNKTVRIPFTISNLFELGIQTQTIELLIDDRLVAADTGRVRIASCTIDDKVKIGFLPDTAGVLEDVLGMTEATYRPLTDRTLMTGDLDAYNVIVVGSGAFRSYPSFLFAKNRFEEYIRQGGSLVILGQPEDWPGDVIPVSFVPTAEVVDQNDLTNRIGEARIMSAPYPISQKNLLSSFYRKRAVTPAVISPAEKVLVTPKGATLLSVSRIGDGQIIFCGLPLTEMISRLDIDAIHLFANILNY